MGRGGGGLVEVSWWTTHYKKPGLCGTGRTGLFLEPQNTTSATPELLYQCSSWEGRGGCSPQTPWTVLYHNFNSVMFTEFFSVQPQPTVNDAMNMLSDALNMLNDAVSLFLPFTQADSILITRTIYASVSFTCSTLTMLTESTVAQAIFSKYIRNSYVKI